MLGTIEQTHVFDLLDAIAARDAKRVLAIVSSLDERAPDYQSVLADIASALQRAAMLQVVPDLSIDESENAESLRRIGNALSPEELQLNYQISLVGRRDLDLAPDARAGFEMILLRMLAFQPARDGTEPAASGGRSSGAQATSTSGKRSALTDSTVHKGTQETQATPSNNEIRVPAKNPSGDEWAAIVAQLNLQGPTSQLAAHCSLRSRQGAKLQLVLDPSGEPFRRPALEDKLVQALSAHFGEAIKLEIEIGEPAVVASIDTPARRHQAEALDRMQAARASIEADPNVRAMRDVFGATVHPESIKPN
jgi:DNA polymerase-3 subunit gamma/tau